MSNMRSRILNTSLLQPQPQMADGVDFSYMQSMLYFDYEGDINSVNGGPPLGEHLSQWLKSAPGFNADKIRTPLRLEADTPMSFLSQWEVYAGLKMQRKPVELVYIPDGEHPLVKPWERMTSQQGNVDWFSFWLMDQEDPDPAKADQYDSWRKMRKALNSRHELN